MELSKDTVKSVEPSEVVQEELSEILDFYSLLLDDSELLHEKLADLLGRTEIISFEEGYNEGADVFEAFKKDPFHEDLELCERIGNKQAHHLFKDCVTLEDFKEIMREVEIQNCIAMPVLGFPYQDIKLSSL